MSQADPTSPPPELQLELRLGGMPVGRARSWHHHVHADITRAPRATDPRVPGSSRHEVFTLSRSPDHLTPALLKACASGELLPAVDLAVHRPAFADQPAKSLLFSLRDVYVVGVLSSLEDSGPMETVRLDYAGITWTFDEDGAQTTTSWHRFEAASA